MGGVLVCGGAQQCGYAWREVAFAVLSLAGDVEWCIVPHASDEASCVIVGLKVFE